MIEYEQIKIEFETIKERVEYILSIDEESRNSDKQLFSKYLEIFTPYALINKDYLIHQIDHFKLTSFDLNLIKNSLKHIFASSLRFKASNLPIFETIRRNRQKIQNEEEHFIPTSEDVARKRNIREELVKKYFIEKKREDGGKS